MTESVKPQVGQWWKSTDRREASRPPLRVVAVDPERVTFESSSGRRSRVKRSRLGLKSKGYRFLHPQEVGHPEGIEEA